MSKYTKNQQLFIYFSLVLMFSIIFGISFAIYNFAGTGTKENSISSGNVSITYLETTNISLNDKYPESDTLGINSTDENSTMQFTISSNVAGNKTVNYLIAFDNITEGETLTSDYIKVYLKKGDSIATGFTEGEGKTISSFKNNKVKGVINSYAILSDVFVGTSSHTYTLKAWVSEDYTAVKNDISSGLTHGAVINSEIYKFKIKVITTADAIKISTDNNWDTSNANVPELASNMIPVYYDGTDWKKADSTNSSETYQWYDYDTKMWANAVTVSEANRTTYLNVTPGTTIPMDDINTMLVWIPRFNAVTPSNYNGGTQTNPGAIDITFVDKTKTAIDAFTFGTESLSGFWYGKFETSHSSLASSTTSNNLGCTTETCINANGIIIKPNVVSLRYNNVSNFFFASRSMEQSGNSFGFVSSEVDTHMSKNNEWGAVAYLTQSIYGRCTSSTSCSEVTINSNTSYITGGNDYETNINQSTTGTIYGIYDMSGGTWEYVMGNYNNTIKSSGFSSMPESKYYNNYTSTTYTGHALTETAGWYSDSSKSFSDGWLARGGRYNNGSSAGIFDFGFDGGSAAVYYASRLAMIK